MERLRSLTYSDELEAIPANDNNIQFGSMIDYDAVIHCLSLKY